MTNTVEKREKLAVAHGKANSLSVQPAPRENGDRKPRLLFVGAFPPPGHRVYGGFVTDCKALMASSLPGRLELDLLDSTQISNPPPGFVRRLLLAVRRLACYLRKLLSGRPDAVLLFASSGGSLMEKGLMAWAARALGRPALLFPRSGAIMDQFRASKRRRLAITMAFGGARAVLCQGPAWQDFAVNELGYAVSDAIVIPNWTASADLIGIGLNRAPASGRARRILYLGWLEEKKGVVELIRAFADLPSEGLVLDMVGDGNARDRAESLARELGVAERVVFHGWKAGAARDELLAKADIFVLPSWAEGLPNAMIEAMAARLPIIVTPVGTIVSYISDGENGLLVEPRSVAGLAAALRRLVEDDALRQKLADAAFQMAQEEFSVEIAADRLAAAVGRYTGRPAAS